MQLKYSNIGAEPITIEEAKSWLKMDGITTDDDLITLLITQIREMAEEISGLSLVVKTIECFEDDTNEIKYGVLLPFPNHDSITEVKLNDVAVDYIQSGLTQFKVKAAALVTAELTEIVLYVKYTTLGYCPHGVKLAILKELTQAYEKRGSTTSESQAVLTSSFINYLSQYKVY